MSRGHGKIQRQCLRILIDADTPMDSITIAIKALGRDSITISESESYRRALRALANQGLITGMSRHLRYGRRAWATPDIAQQYAERIGRTFGPRAEAEERSQWATD